MSGTVSQTRSSTIAQDRDVLAARLPDTPAFVLDLDGITAAAQRVAAVAEHVGCRFYYAVKALAEPQVLRRIAEHVDGLSVSSLSESRLARAVYGGQPGEVQFTSPGIRPDEIASISAFCDTVVFNSLSQWQRFGPEVQRQGATCGLRLNPQLSWLDDDRYDPCRTHSQLGVPLDQLADLWLASENKLSGVRGLHFHTNFRSTTTVPIAETVQHIATAIGPLLSQVAWLNVGGGYELTEMDNAALLPLAETAQWLQRQFDAELIIEPGSTLVRRHGWLVASIIDLFDSEGESIAVLDTSVAHLPELFEYQRTATVLGHSTTGRYFYTLVGCSCLAGDRFGKVRLERPLALGDRVVIADVGAYTLSKIQRFNGLAPPDLWVLNGDDLQRAVH